LWKFRFEGFENLPESGPAILCPNHISFLDSVFTMVHAGRQISFVGKAEYMDSWKTKYLFPALGMIPIDRSGGSKSEGALLAAETVLRRGELFGIFPEGTRSRDGMLYKGHTGAARLAMKVDCPIKIGAPIEVSRYRDRADDHMVLREITDELMFEIQALTGQEYRNVYATKRAESIPTEQAVLNHG
jgi:1-acyl-sn-glycerol-3-phosphate acyltransferase